MEIYSAFIYMVSDMITDNEHDKIIPDIKVRLGFLLVATNFDTAVSIPPTQIAKARPTIGSTS